MYSSLICLLFTFLLAGCEIDEPALDEKKVVYKIEAIKGPHAPKVQRHLFGFVRSCENGLPVVIEYTIAHAPLILKPNKDSMFDNLVVSLSVQCNGIVERAILHYQHCYADRWEYDDMLYNMIAQKIVMMLIVIDKKSKKLPSVGVSDQLQPKVEV